MGHPKNFNHFARRTRLMRTDAAGQGVLPVAAQIHPARIAPAAKAVLQLLNQAGFQAYLVGGYPRNLLCGHPPGDVDIATNALAEEATTLAGRVNGTCHPIGIAHGSILLNLAGVPVTVTSFRSDVATDGRRAVVAFTDRMEVDARRRDFTINALYLDRHGRVFDPCGGLADIERRHVRFIGAPADRIREDHLRILRFFRFRARFVRRVAATQIPAVAEEHQLARALGAIEQFGPNLARLPDERITDEFLKFLTCPNPAAELALMRSSGVLALILPRIAARMVSHVFEMLAACERNTGTAPEAIRRLAAILATAHAPATKRGQYRQSNAREAFLGRLRLSRQQLRRLNHLLDGVASPLQAKALGWEYGQQESRDIILLKAALADTRVAVQDLHQAHEGSAATFPLRARNLADQFAGKALGARLRRARDAWLSSNLELSHSELLRRVRG